MNLIPFEQTDRGPAITAQLDALQVFERAESAALEFRCGTSNPDQKVE